MRKINIRKLTLTGIFAAVAVVGSFFSFPILGARCAPVQHLMNILCAVFLGPFWGLCAAFISSFIRNCMGVGTLLAFPGSMCGALLAGILYKYGKKLIFAYVGEIAGTAVLGGLLAYPISVFVMGNRTAAVFTFVVPFLISTCGGTVIAAVILLAMKKNGLLFYMQRTLYQK